MLQVEIVCNEHVIHPFRTMKFIWISEWLGKVIMYFCILLSLYVGNGQDYTHPFFANIQHSSNWFMFSGHHIPKK